MLAVQHATCSLYVFEDLQAAHAFREAVAERGSTDLSHEFQVLPIVVSTASSAPAAAVQPRVFHKHYPSAYARVITGLDFLLVDRIDAINLSISPDDDLSADDPLVFAIEQCLARGVVVVAAAGNSGPDDDTLQPFAKIDGVISVGAVDDSRRLLDLSSRGPVGGFGPMVVSYGRPAVVYLKEGWDPPTPSTSYAAPRVTRVVAVLIKVLQMLTTTYAKVGGAWPTATTPLPLPTIGFADTGIDQAALTAFPERVAEHRRTRGEFVSFALEDRHQCWFERVHDVVGDCPMAGVTFATIISCLQSVAVGLDGYAPHEVGFGLVSLVECREFLLEMTPTRFVRVFWPGLAVELSQRIQSLDAELGPLWLPAEAETLLQYFHEGSSMRWARVV